MCQNAHMYWDVAYRREFLAKAAGRVNRQRGLKWTKSIAPVMGCGRLGFKAAEAADWAVEWLEKAEKIGMDWGEPPATVAQPDDPGEQWSCAFHRNLSPCDWSSACKAWIGDVGEDLHKEGVEPAAAAWAVYDLLFCLLACGGGFRPDREFNPPTDDGYEDYKPASDD